MKTGKVPENVLKRSVLRQIRTKGEKVLVGAGIGNDCAIFPLSGDGAMVGCIQEAVLQLGQSVGGGSAIKAGTAVDREQTEAIMTIADLIQKCANNLAAGGARPVAVMITLLLPEDAEEALLRELMKAAVEKCRELDLDIAGGQSRVTGAVMLPMAVVTGFGKPFCGRRDNEQAEFRKMVSGSQEPEKETPRSGAVGKSEPGSQDPGKEAPGREAAGSTLPGKAAPGQDVVLSKWIGLQGTAVLVKRGREKLLGRYPAYLVEEAAGFGRYFSVLPEAEIAVKHGVCAMHDASEGGILGALWELAEGAGVGLTVDMRKLPLRQETVEVCECCNVNPYELMSGGCLIMTCHDGLGLAAALEEAGIPATVVGKVTDSNDRILINGDEIRYMNRPERDGIYPNVQEHLPT